MKSRKHWSPGYIVSRARVILDERRNPHDPWLTRQSIDLLAQLLRPSDIALEFGSGRSTRWVARRVHHVTSVENDATWHKAGLERLTAEGIANVDLLLRPKDVPEEEGDRSAYVRAIEAVPDGSIDFCLVDGMYRGASALATLPKMKAGGIIAVDNAGWFLPSDSRTPGARPIGAGFYDRFWTEFDGQTKTWCRIWTTSGVTDTVLLFKV